ncbi:MAG: hypothetical protein O9301_10705 [Leptospira sp.]|nr:hypothetical protein [Leptospira sp.]
MRISSPKDQFLKLTTKEILGRTSGIILQKEALLIMKQIEAYSNKENYARGVLFEPTEASFEKLKLDFETGMDQVWQIIDHGLGTQLFEIRFDSGAGELRLLTVIAGLPGGGIPIEECYHSLLDRSIESLQKYALQKRILTEEIWKKILLKITDFEYDETKGFGDELDEFLDPKKFPFPPSSEMLIRSRGLIADALEADGKIIYLPHMGIYSVSESTSVEFLHIANEVLISKIEPIVRNFDPDIRIGLDRVLDQDNNLDLTDVEMFRRKIDVLYSFRDLLKVKGFYKFVLVLKKISEISKKFEEIENKKEVDKLLKVYLKMLESHFDFDSRLLRINLEKDNQQDVVIIDILRKNPNILSAEWYDPDSKTAVFVLNQTTNIREINDLIYQNYRFTTEYILYLKAIVEANDKDLKELFKDKEFVSTYGKNLQSVYFKYIPWYYKLFYFLGISPIVNSGYAKAKSIITYSQMDRQFQYQKRRENYFKRKIREREEKLERNRKQQLKKALVTAILEAFLQKDTIPSADWINSNYPALTNEIIEKMIPDFAFISTTGKTVKPESVILLPNSVEYSSKNKEIKDLINIWLRDEEQGFKRDSKLLAEIRSLL